MRSKLGQLLYFSQWFWQVFHKLEDNEKKKFLRERFLSDRNELSIDFRLVFLTGSDRVPVFGWSQTQVQKKALRLSCLMSYF